MMQDRASSSRRDPSRAVLAELTAAFLRAMGAPSEARPTVRCVSRRDALAILLDARTRIDDPQLRAFSASVLVENLVQSGILQPLDLGTPERSIALYTVGPQSRDSLDPIEILEAAVPAGVVCYFTALQFYGLTTQLATHHHIARLVQRAPAAPRAPASVRVVPPDSQRTLAPRDPLGTLLFRYQSLPYYRTDRGRHTIAGTQWRVLNDKTIAHITTREQTLLDTLHRPLSCGGPSVVWEAWARGAAELDADNLSHLLQTLNDAPLVRRVGYMLQSHDYAASGELRDVLDDAQRRAASLRDEDAVPLMPGIPGTQHEARWGLRLP